jgi:L-fuconolactonase
VLPIIDAQIHCWYPNTPARPWPVGATSLHGPQFTIGQARDLIAAAGVSRAILVPPPWTSWDAEYSLDAARHEPDRFAVVALFDILAADARQRLLAWRRPGMVGLRITPGRDPDRALLLDRRYQWFWDGVQQARLPVMVFVPGQVGGLEAVLERCPDLRLVIDHAGRRTRGGPMDEAAWADEHELHALARFPKVTVKVSSLPSFTTDPFPFTPLHPHIRAIYDAFGPQRMMWGSDVTRLTCSYADNLRLFTEALDFLDDEDRRWIMGRTASVVFDWPL